MYGNTTMHVIFTLSPAFWRLDVDSSDVRLWAHLGYPHTECLVQSGQFCSSILVLRDTGIAPVSLKQSTDHMHSGRKYHKVNILVCVKIKFIHLIFFFGGHT